MLEVEERKMKKKIDDTSKRAEKIMKIKQENEDKECNQTALFLCFIKAIIALGIGAMPVSKALIVLITVLFLTMLIAHAYRSRLSL